jgi:tartrate-resistant acid phosphatase type 5
VAKPFVADPSNWEGKAFMRRVHMLAGAVLLASALMFAACNPQPKDPSDGSTSSTVPPSSTTSTTTSTTTTTAAPAPPASLAIIGDYGYNHPYIAELGAMVGGWNPDYVLTTGDNLQTIELPATGTDRYDLVVGRHFCAFMANVAPGPFCPSGGQSATNRFFPAPGNHDHADGPLASYLSYFDLPGAGATSTSPTGSEQYYDVVLGPVHVFVLDTQLMYDERDLPAAQRIQTNRQRDWLEQAAKASTSKWKIVTMHEPPFSSGTTYGSTPYVQLPFASFGIDAVFAGHEALYERIERDGVTYVVNGLGGGYPAPFGAPIAGSQVRFNEDVATALRVNATMTSLSMELVTVEGNVIDSFQLPV